MQIHPGYVFLAFGAGALALGAQAPSYPPGHPCNLPIGQRPKWCPAQVSTPTPRPTATAQPIDTPRPASTPTPIPTQPNPTNMGVVSIEIGQIPDNSLAFDSGGRLVWAATGNAVTVIVNAPGLACPRMELRKMSNAVQTAGRIR